MPDPVLAAPRSLFRRGQWRRRERRHEQIEHAGGGVETRRAWRVRSTATDDMRQQVVERDHRNQATVFLEQRKPSCCQGRGAPCVSHCGAITGGKATAPGSWPEAPRRPRSARADAMKRGPAAPRLEFDGAGTPAKARPRPPRTGRGSPRWEGRLRRQILAEDLRAVVDQSAAQQLRARPRNRVV